MFVKFTDISGAPFYINANLVEGLTTREHDGATLILPAAQPDLDMYYTVQEPLESVAEALNRALTAGRECKHVYEAVSTSTGGASYARCSKCGWVPSHNRWE